MSNILERFSRASNSVGLGGTGPASSKSRLVFTPDGQTVAASSCGLTSSLTSSWVIPSVRSFTPKRRPKAGLRMSRPQRMTFLPNKAKDTAKFAARKVLPSPDVDDVKRITFSLSFIMNWILVRMERNISSIWLFLLAWTTIPAESFALSLATGTSATIGNFVIRATSSCPSMR